MHREKQILLGKWTWDNTAPSKLKNKSKKLTTNLSCFSGQHQHSGVPSSKVQQVLYPHPPLVQLGDLARRPALHPAPPVGVPEWGGELSHNVCLSNQLPLPAIETSAVFGPVLSNVAWDSSFLAEPEYCVRLCSVEGGACAGGVQCVHARHQHLPALSVVPPQSVSSTL